MDTADALDLLHDHQNRILAVIERATAAVEGDPCLFRVTLAHARWEMTRLLRAYQIFKHGEIFDPAIAHGPSERARMAEGMKARCIAAGEAFTAYTREWSSRDVVGCWTIYKPAMLAMAKQLRDHIAQERRDIQQLLAGSQRTRKLVA